MNEKKKVDTKSVQNACASVTAKLRAATEKGPFARNH